MNNVNRQPWTVTVDRDRERITDNPPKAEITDNGQRGTDKIRSLFTAYPYKPFHWLAQFNRSILRLRRTKEFEQLLVNYHLNFTQRQDVFQVSLMHNNRLIGFGILQKDNWTSQQLPFPVFKILYLLSANRTEQATKTALVQNILSLISQGQDDRSVRLRRIYLFARIPTADISSIKALQTNGFEPIDSLVTFAGEITDLRKVWEATKPKVQITIGECYESDLSDLFAIASDSFRFDRFHSDPTIPKLLADKIYNAWILDSFCKHQILVARLMDKVCGFISYDISFLPFFRNGKEGIGTIQLIAVAPNFQSLGIGKALIAFAIKLFAESKVSVVSVGTQTNNLLALRLYQSCGFQIVESFSSFRKWLGRDDVS
jgi:dTDP-4-amino-4,6-dideoxy-D-galactose acyltransferase